jgi:EcsC family protein
VTDKAHLTVVTAPQLSHGVQSMEQPHREELTKAKQILEEPAFAAKISNLIGLPLEKGIQYLPERWAETITNVSGDALGKALKIAVLTLDRNIQTTSHEMWHKLAVTVTGAGGGAFGLPALAVELPISTVIMLRSIADIGRSEGEDLRQPEARLACLQVFALGGKAKEDDAADSGYFAIRAALASTITEAAHHIAKGGIVNETAPKLLQLIANIAGRFGIAVSQKTAAQAIPIIGAAGGALINLAFIDHFQGMARGHFIVRRLERLYGEDIVHAEYETL